ncbi:MAG: QueT transporter family protein [Clostridiaceae bacterium]|nr:QueT transporter family protein [Clostridiaceae bacterium]
MRKSFSAKRIVRSALIAAMYFALSAVVPAVEFGPIQFRISEALVLLPVLMPLEGLIGVTVGCLTTNIFFSPFGWLDAVIGTTATLVAAALTVCFRKRLPVAAVPPVILNALMIPLIWIVTGEDTVYYINAFSIMASEALVVFVIGLPLTYALKKYLPKKLYLDEPANKKTVKAEPDGGEPLDVISEDVFAENIISEDTISENVISEDLS